MERAIIFNIQQEQSQLGDIISKIKSLKDFESEEYIKVLNLIESKYRKLMTLPLNDKKTEMVKKALEISNRLRDLVYKTQSPRAIGGAFPVGYLKDKATIHLRELNTITGALTTGVEKVGTLLELVRTGNYHLVKEEFFRKWKVYKDKIPLDSDVFEVKDAFLVELNRPSPSLGKVEGMTMDFDVIFNKLQKNEPITLRKRKKDPKQDIVTFVEKNEPTTQKTISEDLGLSKTSCSGWVNELVKEGVFIEKPHPEDKRKKLIYLKR